MREIGVTLHRGGQARLRAVGPRALIQGMSLSARKSHAIQNVRPAIWALYAEERSPESGDGHAHALEGVQVAHIQHLEAGADLVGLLTPLVGDHLAEAAIIAPATTGGLLIHGDGVLRQGAVRPDPGPAIEATPGLHDLPRVAHAVERLDLGPSRIERGVAPMRGVAARAHHRDAIHPAGDTEGIGGGMQRGPRVVEGDLLTVSGAANAQQAHTEARPVAARKGLVGTHFLGIDKRRAPCVLVLVGELQKEAAHGGEPVEFRACGAKEGMVLEKIRVQLQPSFGVAQIRIVVAVEHRHVVLRALAVDAVVVVVVIEGQLLIGASEIDQLLVLEQDAQEEELGIVRLLVVGDELLREDALKHERQLAHQLAHDLLIKGRGVAIPLLRVGTERGVMAHAGKRLHPDMLPAHVDPTAIEDRRAPVPSPQVGDLEDRRPGHSLPFGAREGLAIFPLGQLVLEAEGQAVVSVGYLVEDHRDLVRVDGIRRLSEELAVAINQVAADLEPAPLGKEGADEKLPHHPIPVAIERAGHLLHCAVQVGEAGRGVGFQGVVRGKVLLASVEVGLAAGGDGVIGIGAVVLDGERARLAEGAIANENVGCACPRRRGRKARCGQGTLQSAPHPWAASPRSAGRPPLPSEEGAPFPSAPPGRASTPGRACRE